MYVAIIFLAFGLAWHMAYGITVRDMTNNTWMDLYFELCVILSCIFSDNNLLNKRTKNQTRII